MKGISIFRIARLQIPLSLIWMMGCSPSGNQDGTFTEMPPERPDGLVVEYHEGGGMVNESSNIFVSLDSSYYLHQENGMQNKYYFTIEAQEYDKLWTTLRSNFFNKIKMVEEGEVYDRGGVTISLRWGKESISISNSGSTFIDKKWQDHFSAVVQAVENLPGMYLRNKYREIAVTVSSALNPPLADSLNLVHYQIDGSPFSKGWTGKPQEKFSGFNETLRLLPGKYHLYTYSKIGNREVSGESDIMINDSIAGIEILVEANQMAIHFK